MIYRYSIFSGSYNLLNTLRIFLKSLTLIFLKENLITNYEKQLSLLYNKKYAVSFASGRMALYASLKSLNLQQNDEIIIAPFTCVVVINAILYAGCKPIYCDIDLSNYCIDLDKVEHKINSKTKLIYIQHTFGHTLNFSKLNKIVKDNNLLLIEDAAHHLRLSNQYKSDLIFNSSDSSKMFDTYLGGTSFTNDNKIYKKIKNIQKNSKEFSKMSKIRIIFSFFIKTILHNPNIYPIGRYINILLQKLGFYFTQNDELKTKLIDSRYTYKIFNFIALLGLDQIKNIKQNIKHRSYIVLQINKILNLYHFNNAPPPLLRYSFMVKNREDFEKIFSDYDLSIWFKSMFEGRTSNFNEIHYTVGSCPNAEFASKHIVNIPTHLNIKSDKLIKLLKKNRNYILKNIIS